MIGAEKLVPGLGGAELGMVGEPGTVTTRAMKIQMATSSKIRTIMFA